LRAIDNPLFNRKVKGPMNFRIDDELFHCAVALRAADVAAQCCYVSRPCATVTICERRNRRRCIRINLLVRAVGYRDGDSAADFPVISDIFEPEPDTGKQRFCP